MPSTGPGKPSAKPTIRPSAQPTSEPTSEPTAIPTQPTAEPTSEPTAGPTRNPTFGAYYYNSQVNAPKVVFQTDDYKRPQSQTSSSGGGVQSLQSWGPNDDFKPGVPIVIDNGNIFTFAENAAKQFAPSRYFKGCSFLKKWGTNPPGVLPPDEVGYNGYDFSNNPPYLCSNADTAVSDVAYDAITDTLEKNGSFTKNFNKLCGTGPNSFGPIGCAIIALQFSGVDNRDISDYFFQPVSMIPSKGPVAYTNTMYRAATFEKFARDTPTKLKQVFYDCHKTQSQAFLAAVGIAFSNAQLGVTVGFTALIILIVQFLNRTVKKKAPILTVAAKKMKLKNKAKARNRKIDSTLNKFRELEQMLRDGALTAGVPVVLEDIPEEENQIQKVEIPLEETHPGTWDIEVGESEHGARGPVRGARGPKAPSFVIDMGDGADEESPLGDFEAEERVKQPERRPAEAERAAASSPASPARSSLRSTWQTFLDLVEDDDELDEGLDGDGEAVEEELPSEPVTAPGLRRR